MESIDPYISYWEMHLNDMCQLASTDFRKVSYTVTEDHTGIPSMRCDLLIDGLKVMQCDQVLKSGQTTKGAWAYLREQTCKLMTRVFILYSIEKIQRATNHPGLANTIEQIQSCA